jgi:quercetin dioxygenase-like cupin family protein
MCKIKQCVAVEAYRRAKRLAVLRPVITAFVFISASAAAQTVVPITSEPSHHLVISNHYVRVFEVEVPPHAETLYHQHDYDYLYVAIGDADVTSTRLNEKPVGIKLKDGEVELSRAPFAHKAVNNGDQPFRNVTIELLQGTGKPICGLAGGDKSCGFGGPWRGTTSANSGSLGSGYPQILSSSRLAVSDFRTDGGMEIVARAPHTSPFLLVAVSDLRVRLKSQKGTREVSVRAGDVFWMQEPETKLLMFPNEARFIMVSVLPPEKQ